MNMSTKEVVDNFSMMDDWESRYAYLIDLGKVLPEMDAAIKTDAARVQGCMSQVWMVLTLDPEDRIVMYADSDAQIVRGLIALLYAAFAGKTKDEAKAFEVEAYFSALGLDQHLSPNRRNGFFSMLERIQGFIARCT